jgi:outer membrane protein TolC
MPRDIDAFQAWLIECQARFGSVPGAEQFKAELERAMELGKELVRERDRLQGELVRAEAERDGYLRALARYMAKEFPELRDIDENALRAQVVQKPTLAELIAELEHAEDQ